MIVSRLSHVAEDVTLAANHVSRAKDPWFYKVRHMLTDAEGESGTPRQIEQRADAHDLEQSSHSNNVYVGRCHQRRRLLADSS